MDDYTSLDVPTLFVSARRGLDVPFQIPVYSNMEPFACFLSVLAPLQSSPVSRLGYEANNNDQNGSSAPISFSPV
jgi:hypothetical protein